MPQLIFYMQCPDTLRQIAIRGSRCGCTAECGRVFSGDEAHRRHRVGRYDRYEERCLRLDELLEHGYKRKPSGVMGRSPQGCVSVGTAEPSGTKDRQPYSALDPEPMDADGPGDDTQGRAAP